MEGLCIAKNNKENQGFIFCGNIVTTQCGLVQQEAVDRATATLACTESEARIALRHFRWNFDGLMGVHHVTLCAACAILQARATSVVQLPFKRTGAGAFTRPPELNVGTGCRGHRREGSRVCLFCGGRDHQRPSRGGRPNIEHNMYDLHGSHQSAGGWPHHEL